MGTHCASLARFTPLCSADWGRAKSTHTHTHSNTCNNRRMSTHSLCQVSTWSDRNRVCPLSCSGLWCVIKTTLCMNHYKFSLFSFFPCRVFIWNEKRVSDEFTHFAFDVWRHTEEQRAVETQFDHVVPILRGQDSLRERRQSVHGKIHPPKFTNPDWEEVLQR